MLSKEKIDQVDSFIYQISNNGGCSETIQGEIAKAKGLFFTTEISLEEKEDESVSPNQNIECFSDDSGQGEDHLTKR